MPEKKKKKIAIWKYNVLEWLGLAVDENEPVTIHFDPRREGVSVPDEIPRDRLATVKVEPADLGADHEGICANVRIGDDVRTVEIPLEAMSLVERRTSLPIPSLYDSNPDLSDEGT